MSKKFFQVTTVLFLITTLCLAACSYILVRRVDHLDTQMTAQADGAGKKLAEIQAIVDRYYIGQIDEDDMADSLAAGLISGLGDQWSYYIPEESYESYQENVANAYVGIGVTVKLSEDNSGCTITDVTPGGPAEEAGLLPDDMIVAVEGTSLEGMGLEQIKNLIRGEEGTAVEITYQREGQKQTVAVTRTSIATVNVTYELLQQEIGYIRIRNFESNCAQDAQKAVEEVIAQGADYLLFDVRFNPGGLKTELVEFLDYLLPEGVLFRSEDYQGQVQVDESDEACVDLPMAVLVNESTYSAAEFFAAALQEYGVAQVVGVNTSGKGYYQSCFPLSDGSAINLSIGKYYTPNGKSLTDVGITPDVVVELSDEDNASLYRETLDVAQDQQLQQAINVLIG